MSSISKCSVSYETPWVMPPAALAKAMVVAGVLLALGVAHLSLRFHLARLQRETSTLQARQGVLASDVKALQGRTESLKNPQRLFEYARLELGMVPTRQDAEKRIVQVSDEAFKSFELARAEFDGRLEPVRKGGTSAGEAWYEKVSDRLGLIGQAVAGEPSDKPELAAEKVTKSKKTSGKAKKTGKTTGKTKKNQE